MAKIKKLIEDNVIHYPATITDAVKNPNNGKTVTEELSELGSEVNSIQSAYGSVNFQYGYISTGDVGYIVSSFTSNGSIYWESSLLSAKEGDKFYIKGKGGSDARLWAFLDANSQVLSSSGRTYTSSGEYIIAPSGSSLLVVNFKLAESDGTTYDVGFYKKTRYDTSIEEANDKIVKNQNDIGRLEILTNIEEDKALQPKSNGYINTYAEIGSKIDLIIDSNSADWCNYIIPVSVSHMFKISGKGGSDARLWAFVDENNRLVSVSSARLVANDLILEVPENARYLIVNTNIAEGFTSYVAYVYKPKSQLEEINKLIKINAEGISSMRSIFGEINLEYGYITTGDVGDEIISFTPNGLEFWKSSVLSVSENDKFYIEGKGGSDARLWTFVDENNIVLSSSNRSHISRGEEIIAPENAVTLVVNFENPETVENTPSYVLYKKSRYDNEFESLKDVIENVNVNIEKKKVNLLIFGNSYSFRCCAQGPGNILNLCKSLGKDMFLEVVGNGGASFQTNYTKHLNNQTNDYRWEGDTNSGIVDKDSEPLTFVQAVSMKDWDYIVFHQSSKMSGDIESFSPYLDNLIESAKLYCPNENVKIGLMQTWAYADIMLKDSGTHVYPSTSTIPTFQNQQEMYEAICNTYKEAMKRYEDVTFLIPCGTALQNARKTSLGSIYNDFGASENDGSHINNVGTLITTFAVFNKVYGEKNNIKLSDVKNNYSSLLTDAEFELALNSAKNAIKFPFRVI